MVVTYRMQLEDALIILTTDPELAASFGALSVILAVVCRVVRLHTGRRAVPRDVDAQEHATPPADEVSYEAASS